MRRSSSATTSRRPGAPAIDFRRREVRRFFTENALYWLMEYRFDGLRFDAVHAIAEADWLDEMAARSPRHRRAGPPCPSGAGARRQCRRPSAARFRCAVERRRPPRAARAADRRERRLLRRLCGPAGRAAGALPCARASSIRAIRRAHRNGEPRGTPSADLPPTAFVLFLQNHDQIGNRAFGDRLTALAEPRGAGGRDRAAAALPADSAAVHGRGGREPDAVPVLHRSSWRTGRCGARRPPARVRELCGVLRSGAPRADPRPERGRDVRALAARSRDAEHGDARRALYRRLLALAARASSCRASKAPRRSARSAIGRRRCWRAGGSAMARC